MQAQVFNLTLSPEQAQATLSALEREVESCVEADLRDRQSFGFGPVIHEDSARDRAYLQQRKFAAESTLLAMKDAGVPYAEESLQRARGAHDRIWAAFQREEEEKALFARLDLDDALFTAVKEFTFALDDTIVGRTAKAHGSFVTLRAIAHALLLKANAEAPGWAAEVPALASHALNLARALPASSAAKVHRAGFGLDESLASARRKLKVVAR